MTTSAQLLNNAHVEELLNTLWFADRQDDEPVYLGLEDEFLKSHGWEPEDVATRISRYVVEELDLNKPNDIFYSLRKKLYTWRNGDRKLPPPILSTIGASILAAQNMHRDEQYSANAYYPRLAALLRQKVSSEQLRSNFDEVVTMWETLHEWILQNPDLGPSMISSLGPHVRIGFPRSQATVTARDRSIFSMIKTKISPEKLDQLTDEDLLNELRLWSNKSSGFRFSSAFLTSLHGRDDRIQEFIIHAFRSAPVQNGFGSSTRIHRIAAELWYEFESQQFSWVIPKDKRLKGFIGTDVNGKELRTQESFISEVWETDALPPVSAQTLESEYSWKSDKFTVKISKRNYWIFQDVDSNAVMSTRSDVRDDRFSLLIPSNFMHNLIEAHDVDFTSIEHYSNVFEGWDFYVDIPSQEHHDLLHVLDESLAVPPDKSNVEQIRLDGGIRLGSVSGIKGYLELFEPDLIVEKQVETYTLILDDDKEQSGLKATGQPLPISKLVSGVGLRKLTVPPVWESSYQVFSARQAWGFSQINTHGIPTAVINSERKILARRDRYYFAILENGTVEELSNWGQPSWLRLRQKSSSSSVYDTNFQHFMLALPRECIWMVSLHETRPPVITEIEKRNISVDKEAVRKSADVWRTVFSLVPAEGIAEISILLQMVKEICK